MGLEPTKIALERGRYSITVRPCGYVPGPDARHARLYLEVDGGDGGELVVLTYDEAVSLAAVLIEHAEHDEAERLVEQLETLGLVHFDPTLDAELEAKLGLTKGARPWPTREPDAAVERKHERSSGHRLISIDHIPADSFPFLPTDPAADTAVDEPIVHEWCDPQENEQCPICEARWARGERPPGGGQ